MTRGWKGERYRHSLSAKGIKSARGKEIDWESHNRLREDLLKDERIQKLWEERKVLMHDLADDIRLPDGWEIKWMSDTNFTLEIFDLDKGYIASIHVHYDAHSKRPIKVRSGILNQREQFYKKPSSALNQIDFLLEVWEKHKDD